MSHDVLLILTLVLFAGGVAVLHDNVEQRLILSVHR